jgi:hypothetical protein
MDELSWLGPNQIFNLVFERVDELSVQTASRQSLQSQVRPSTDKLLGLLRREHGVDGVAWLLDLVLVVPADKVPLELVQYVLQYNLFTPYQGPNIFN